MKFIIFAFSIIGVDLKPSIRSMMNNAGVDIQKHQTVIDHMAGYIVQSRAVSTRQKYMNYFKHFEKYCVKNGFVSKPASSIVVAMYLTNMLDHGKSYGVISSTVYSIKWMHSLHDYVDPTTNSMVKHLLETSKRECYEPVKKKDTIDSEMLQTLCDNFSDSSDVVTLRDLSIILLGFAGFLRFNELNSLICSDITFNDDHLVINIRKSKTDVYRQGKSVPICKGTTNACPFNMLKKYMRAACLDVTCNEFLFRPCFRSKGVSALIKSNKKLSYTRVRECILSKLKLVAPNLNLGTHSLRASGVTVAANSGVSDRCLKRHGRWKTDIAKDGYIVDSLDSRLSITKKLKL
jgi:integrase